MFMSGKWLGVAAKPGAPYWPLPLAVKDRVREKSQLGRAAGIFFIKALTLQRIESATKG
jgi:hypothetical protein